MSKAKDLAKELYSDWKMTGVPTVDGIEESMVRIQRVAYVKGYQQAEKDIELTWEDIETIQEMANEYCKYHSCEPRFFVYKEVLKQFKDFKERKKK